MNVLFVAGFGPIVRDIGASARFYRDALGLPLPGATMSRPTICRGVKHFGLWALADAAESCFGTSEWPKDVPVPQGGIELDVDDVAEPWGQTVARLLSPEGLLVGLTITPWMREGGGH